MLMSEDEICQQYLHAKFPIKQIKILSEINECSKIVIENILNKNNIQQHTKGYERQEEVQRIVHMHVVGYSCETIGRMYGICGNTVSKILRKSQKNESDL